MVNLLLEGVLLLAETRNLGLVGPVLGLNALLDSRPCGKEHLCRVVIKSALVKGRSSLDHLVIMLELAPFAWCRYCTGRFIVPFILHLHISAAAQTPQLLLPLILKLRVLCMSQCRHRHLCTTYRIQGADYLCTVADLPPILPTNVFILDRLAIRKRGEETSTCSWGIGAVAYHKQHTVELHEGCLALHPPFDMQCTLLVPLRVPLSHDAL